MADGSHVDVASGSFILFTRDHDGFRFICTPGLLQPVYQVLQAQNIPGRTVPTLEVTWTSPGTRVAHNSIRRSVLSSS